MCTLLGARFLVFAILADSFFKLFVEALSPLIYRVIFLQELNPHSTSQLQTIKSMCQS